MWKKILLYGLAAVMGIAAAAGLSAVFTLTEVEGCAMEPAIKEGRKVLINKLAFCTEDADVPEIGSVVAFHCDVHSEEGEGRVLVRRVAANGGNTVEIRNNIFYLNGEPYTEYMNEPAAMEDMSVRTLGKYEIFVLSDNRKSSMDSRDEAVGILDFRECIGQVCFE